MATLIGEAMAEALWTHIDLAEAARLRAVYGYAKDNAFPPHLKVRLADPVFAQHLISSVHDEGAEALSAAVRRLLDHARGDVDRQNEPTP